MLSNGLELLAAPEMLLGVPQFQNSVYSFIYNLIIIDYFPSFSFCNVCIEEFSKGCVIVPSVAVVDCRIYACVCFKGLSV